MLRYYLSAIDPLHAPSEDPGGPLAHGQMRLLEGQDWAAYCTLSTAVNHPGEIVKRSHKGQRKG